MYSKSFLIKLIIIMALIDLKFTLGHNTLVSFRIFIRIYLICFLFSFNLFFFFCSCVICAFHIRCLFFFSFFFRLVSNIFNKLYKANHKVSWLFVYDEYYFHLMRPMKMGFVIFWHRFRVYRHFVYFHSIFLHFHWLSLNATLLI